MKYTPVIGLEIHVELNTKTKMFCSCSADYFGKEPNTHTCPVCLGLPGALPYTNQEALEKCMMIGLALNCKVSESSYFERKNYFYPDLPKGYQISQYRKPLCVDGNMELSDGSKIRINRVHQEEDTAKLVHQLGISNSQFSVSNEKQEVAIDFNRSGVPLVEIVTEPDFTNSAQVVEFAKALHRIFKDLNVSNADMERGDVRLEANVSVRPEGQTELPNYRIELKNINSFRFMQHAVEYEIKRQAEELEKGTKLTQETRGWDEDKRESYLQRSKEEAHDYRYFPEPDLPEPRYSEQEVKRIREQMPKLSKQLEIDLQLEFNIPQQSAYLLTRNKDWLDLFRCAVEYKKEKGYENINNRMISGWIINKRADLSCERLIEAIKNSLEKDLMSAEDLEIAVVSVIKHNEKVVEDFRNGKDSVIQFLIGQVMKETKGQASALEVKEMLLKKINV